MDRPINIEHIAHLMLPYRMMDSLANVLLDGLVRTAQSTRETAMLDASRIRAVLALQIVTAFIVTKTPI